MTSNPNFTPCPLRAHRHGELDPFCGERPDTGMGFVRMERACVLPLHHGGEMHQAKDGTTFPRKRAPRPIDLVPERRRPGR